jgi:hypothetical protein
MRHSHGPQNPNKEKSRANNCLKNIFPKFYINII